MTRCTHKGCGQEFDEANNVEGSCKYHPGAPVFHEGLKSWSCCNEVNKPVLEFDQFMAIPGCATGKHTTEAPVVAPKPTPASSAPTTVKGGVETYGAVPAAKPSTPAAQAPVHIPTPQPEVKETEEDDLSVPVPADAKCKRAGCGAAWEGEEISRGDGPKAVCHYHPMGPIFHEGSKGYLCCKRRVLEFSEFLKLPGCTEGKHLFVGAKKDPNQAEIVPCRIDHYQTPMTVNVSVYAKGADKETSKVTFGPQEVHLDLHLPGNKRVVRTLELYGAIDPDKCSYRVLGTKIDIVLTKPFAASWPLLELPPPGTELPPGYAITFGVHGRTGTVGGKEVVLSAEEAAKQAADK